MSRLIDADVLIPDCKKTDFCKDCIANVTNCIDFMSTIKHAPTIDAVPVIRCKDCKYRQEDTIFHKLYCDGREVVADGYCWKGERKSDE